MKSKFRSAALCVGLFVFSFVILKEGMMSDGYLPSSDYIETAVSVFNESDTSDLSAINPSAANVILCLLDGKSEPVTEVLPPILTPPEAVKTDSVN